MNIHFIDISVFANILDIPNMNADRKLVIAEFNKLIKSKKDRLILPYATLIETGNHIAHENACSDPMKKSGKVLKDHKTSSKR